MENITIINGRENTLEFDIDIQGANKKKPVVRFVVENKSISYTFQCKHSEDNDWTVIIPIIPELKNKPHPFRIEVIVDGYYFEPFRGTAEVLAEPEVKTKDVNNTQPDKPVISSVNVKNSDKSTKPEPKKEKASVETDKKKTTKVKEVKEEGVEPIEVEETPSPLEDFKDMASRWLNREKSVVTEKDKTVKTIINNTLTPTQPITIDETDNVDDNVDEIVTKIQNEKESGLSEKAIKVQAILKSIT